MSDCCYLTLNFAVSDAKKVYDVFGKPEMEPEPPKDGVLTASFPEADAGGCRELETLCDEGIPFFGWHTSGDDYDAATFCFDGEHAGRNGCDFEEWSADQNGNAVIVVTLEKAGLRFGFAKDLQNVRAFLRHEVRAKKAVKARGRE